MASNAGEGPSDQGNHSKDPWKLDPKLFDDEDSDSDREAKSPLRFQDLKSNEAKGKEPEKLRRLSVLMREAPLCNAHDTITVGEYEAYVREYPKEVWHLFSTYTKRMVDHVQNIERDLQKAQDTISDMTAQQQDWLECAYAYKHKVKVKRLSLEQTISDLRKKLHDAKTEPWEKHIPANPFEDSEVEEPEEDLESVRVERDVYKKAAEAFAQRARRHTTVEAAATAATAGTVAKRSPKHPDPPKLSDGKEPDFEYWLSQARIKLEMNADWFPVASRRVAYLMSCLEGEAHRHARHRYGPDSEEPYLDAEDLFEHMITIYRDPNRVEAAEDEFYDLSMDVGEDFQAFVTKFAGLAQDSKLPKKEWKSHLVRKITPTMREMVWKERYDPKISYQELVKILSRADRTLKQNAAANQDKKANLRPGKNAKTPANGKAAGGANPAAGKGRLSVEERETPMKLGACFFSKAPGHCSADCPQRKANVDETAMEILKALKQSKEYSKSGKESS